MAQLLSDAVKVTARITPEGVSRREFGIGLYLHHVTTSITERDEAEFIRKAPRYANADGPKDDNAPTAVRTAAGVWFQQSPFPRNLVVGTIIGAAQSSLIFSKDDLSVTGIEALGDNASLSLGGNVFTADFDGLTTLADIATALQVGIRSITGHTTVTVTVNGTGLLITGTTSLDFGDGFADTTNAQALGLVGDGVSVLRPVEAAETADVALDRIVDIDNSFFWVAIAPTVAEDNVLVDAVRDWVAAREYVYGTILDLYGEGVLTANETMSLGATLFAQLGNGIAAIWNGRTTAEIDQKGLSYAARFSSINFNAPNAVINGKFLQLPGTTARNLTTSQIAELRRKRINYYRPIGTGGDTEEGRTFGTWLDVYVWIAWFKNALEVAGYNYLKQSSPLGGVPITDQGLAGIADALEEVCELGVRNGGIAPNNVSPAFRDAIRRATGNDEFDGFLSTGYLVVRPTAAQVDQTIRNARGPIPISIYVKGSGKVNQLEIGVDFEN